MKFFNYVASDLFVKFLKSYGDPLAYRIEFREMESHEIKEYSEELYGCYEKDHSHRIISVYINNSVMNRMGFPYECREITAAHEILHVKLEKDGFPVTRSPSHLPKNSPNRKIASVLSSTIHHITINALLTDHGFNTSLEKRCKGQAYLDIRKSNSLEEIGFDQPLFFKHILDYIDASLSFSNDIMLVVRQILDNQNKRLLTIAERCLGIVGNENCSIPSGALTAMINLRNKLGLKDHGIFVEDTVNKIIY